MVVTELKGNGSGDIDILINHLQEAKEKGATHYDVYYKPGNLKTFVELRTLTHAKAQPTNQKAVGSKKPKAKARATKN